MGIGDPTGKPGLLIKKFLSDPAELRSLMDDPWLVLHGLEDSDDFLKIFHGELTGVGQSPGDFNKIGDINFTQH
jgi:hypothetical protein